MSVSSRKRPQFELRLFGGPHLTKDGESVVLSPYQAYLMALVYGHEESGISRSEAAWLLWEQDDTPKTRQRMRQLLHWTKQKAQWSIIDTDVGDNLVGTPEVVACDLRTYRELIAGGELASATDLLRQTFCGQLRGLPSEEYEDWLYAKRLTLVRASRDLASHQWDQGAASGDWSRLRVPAESLFFLDPKNERYLQMVMEARTLTGSPQLAESAYHTFVENLEDGSHPSRKTQELVERVRLVGPAHPIKVQQDAAFRGRGGELGRLQAALSDRPHGSISVVALTGEAGIGKTRTAQAYEAEMRLSGWTTSYAACSELEAHIPFSPLIDILLTSGIRQSFASIEGPWRAAIANLAPELLQGSDGIELPDISAEDNPRRTFEAIRQLIDSAAEDRPTLIIIDDLQWIDASSLSALSYLFRRPITNQVAFLVAYRSQSASEAVPDRLHSLLNHFADIVHLGGLSIRDSVDILGEVSGGKLETEMMERLAIETEGNPLILSEIGRAAMRGEFSATEIDRLPTTAERLLARRMDDLNPFALQALELLALCHNSLSLDVLMALLDLSADECTSGLDQLLAKGLVATEQDGVYVRHDLLRATVVRRTGEMRARWLHESIAELLADTPRSPLSAIAWHFHFAGIGSRAADFATKAAQHAEARGALPEASDLLALARSHTSEPTAQARLAFNEARLRRRLRDIDHTIPLLHLAIAEFDRSGCLQEVRRAQLEYLHALADQGVLPIQDLLNELSRLKAVAREGGDLEVLVKALDLELHVAARLPVASEIRRVLVEAEVLSNSDDPTVSCVGYCILAVKTYIESADAGVRAARQAYACWDAVDTEYQLRAASRLTMALLHAGRLDSDEGREVWERGHSLALDAGDLLGIFFFRMNRGVWLLEAGEYRLAKDELAEASRVIEGVGLPRDEVLSLINQGEVALQLGDIGEASAFFSSAQRLTSTVSDPTLSQIAWAGSGLCELWDGRIRQATEIEERLAADPLEWHFDPTLTVLLRARLLAAHDRHEEAAEYVMGAVRTIMSRFVPTAFKLAIEALRIGLGSDQATWIKICEEVRSAFGEVPLVRRQEEFSRLLSIRESM